MSREKGKAFLERLVSNGADYYIKEINRIFDAKNGPLGVEGDLRFLIGKKANGKGKFIVDDTREHALVTLDSRLGALEALAQNDVMSDRGIVFNYAYIHENLVNSKTYKEDVPVSAFVSSPFDGSYGTIDDEKISTAISLYITSAIGATVNAKVFNKSKVMMSVDFGGHTMHFELKISPSAFIVTPAGLEAMCYDCIAQMVEQDDQWEQVKTDATFITTKLLEYLEPYHNVART